MLDCPHCQARRIAVIDSRTVNNGSYVRRRLSCKACSKRFSSYEIREIDLVDSHPIHFSSVLSRLRQQANKRKGVHADPEPYWVKTAFMGLWQLSCLRACMPCLARRKI